ncbi:MAG: hypothetical protein ACI4U3_10090 [Traorella sp.]
MIKCFKKMTSFESNLFVYSLSFSLLLTMAPAISLAVYSLHLLQFDPHLLIEPLSSFLPESFIVPFIEFLLKKNIPSMLTSLISILVTFYLSSRSIYSFLLIALSEEKVVYPLWSLRIYSIYEFVLIYLYVFIYLMFNSLFNSFLMTILLYFGVSLIGFYIFYHLCTFKANKRTYGLSGAIFTTVSIYLIGTLFFKLIIHYKNYDNIYGPLSSYMLLLVVVYMISWVIYMGYIINNSQSKLTNEMNRNNTFFKICAKIETKIIERIQYESRNKKKWY